MKQFATITVIGKDKTGVIARITHYLFETHANIEALEEQVTRGQFSMTIQASWRACDWQLGPIRSGLQVLARELAMEIKLRFTEPHRLQRAALFATREPHCLEALLEAFASNTLKAEPRLVIANRKDLAGVAANYHIPFAVIPWQDRVRAETRAMDLLDQHEIDFVVLARFMKILSPGFVWRFKNKIINIHPSLLPSFPGPQAYRQAYEHGVKIIGVTAHFVSMQLDEGPIIAQGAFAVPPRMDLGSMVARGQRLESKVLLRAVRLYLTRRLDVHWGIVKEV